MSKSIYFFPGDAKATLGEVGGKGLSLLESSRARIIGGLGHIAGPRRVQRLEEEQCRTTSMASLCSLKGAVAAGRPHHPGRIRPRRRWPDRGHRGLRAV